MKPKNIVIVIVLIAGCYLLYKYIASKASPPTTKPMGTARLYLKAAIAGNEDAVKQLCEKAGQSSALSGARKLHSLNLSLTGAKYRNTSSERIYRKGVMVRVGSTVVVIGMNEIDGEWKIRQVQISGE